MTDTYTSSQAASKIGISRLTLCMWENAGKIPKAKRWERNNHRFYTDEDIAHIIEWKSGTKTPDAESMLA